jgi:hypothetical protein
MAARRDPGDAPLHAEIAPRIGERAVGRQFLDILRSLAPRA